MTERMDVKYINPFIESVGELFTMMLSCDATMGKVQVADPAIINGEIIALIALNGAIRGTVALVFPVPTALSIAGRLTGEHIRRYDNSVNDAVAELVNIVAGASKAKLSDNQTPAT